MFLVPFIQVSTTVGTIDHLFVHCDFTWWWSSSLIELCWFISFLGNPSRMGLSCLELGPFSRGTVDVEIDYWYLQPSCGWLMKIIPYVGAHHATYALHETHMVGRSVCMRKSSVHAFLFPWLLFMQHIFLLLLGVEYVLGPIWVVF